MIFESIHHVVHTSLGPGPAPRWHLLQRKCPRCTRPYVVGPAFERNACPYCGEPFMHLVRHQAALALLQMPEGDRLILAVFSEEP
jgi:hypothetical protein